MPELVEAGGGDGFGEEVLARLCEGDLVQRTVGAGHGLRAKPGVGMFSQTSTLPAKASVTYRSRISGPPKHALVTVPRPPGTSRKSITSPSSITLNPRSGLKAT